MRKWQLMLLCTLAVSCLAVSVPAETVVVDFDDYEGPLAPIPDGYAGFTNWGNFAYSSTEQPPAYVPRSGTTYAVPVGGVLPITFGDYYVLLGAWFIGYEPNAVAFELYADGELVHTSEILNVGFEYQWLDAGYTGLVDQVKVIYAVGSNFWAMDDFSYENEVVATENATWSGLKNLYR